MGGGLRILSLDGGGTRALSTLYILKEIMSHNVPGNGGSIRPSEYFDIIGASGPNALLALLFVRFAFTIDEALDWLHEFARRVDKSEEIFNTKTGEDLDENDFREIESKDSEPEVQIETVRRQVLSNTWSENITKQFTDWFELSKHRENGKFNFKSPLADIGVGRCRAAVTGSEAAGYGPNGGIVKDRVYHAPIWHRSYEGRHTKRTYTFYAIALGTVASPGIVSNGLIFPELSAPGADIVHNPVLLLLQECQVIWPGLRPRIILSIGTGKLELPEHWDFNLHPYAQTAANASLAIQKENQKIANDVEKYVMPHDKTFRSAYFRFDVPTSLPFFEHEARDFILEQTLQYLQDREVTTQTARLAEVLEEESFPSTWEDQIALSSLASLSTAFASSGYNNEAELVSDCISTYILYEPTKIDSGTHRKLFLAASADRLAQLVRTERPWTGSDLSGNKLSAPYPAAFFLNLLTAYGDFEGIPEELSVDDPLADLSSMSDIAAGCYSLLSAERGRDTQEMNSGLFINVLRQISKMVSMPVEVTRSLIIRVETLFRISSLAALCEQACVESLTAEPRLLLSGQFIRHLTTVILQCDLQHVDIRFLEPVANAISEILRLTKWSIVRDPLIVKLLAQDLGQGKESWGLVNLAVEREAQHIRATRKGQNIALSDCNTSCQKVIQKFGQLFQSERNKLAVWSVDRGYLGLLRKLLEGDELSTAPRVYAPKPCNSAASIAGSIDTYTGGNLLHRAAAKAYIPGLKMMVECLGKIKAPPLFSALDNDGLSPLHICVQRRGDIDTLLLCIYAGADLDHDSLTGQTALHYCFPRKEEIHDYFPAVEDLSKEHGLLITLPIKPPRAWGIHGGGREIGRPTSALRNFVHQLSCHGASVALQDLSGATPAHLAAVTGWGVNVDMLFIRGGETAEGMARELLQVRDRHNNSVLSVMRAMDDEEGERIISAEMRKRCIDTTAINNPQTTPSYPIASPKRRRAETSLRVSETQRKPLASASLPSPLSHTSPSAIPTPPTNQPPPPLPPRSYLIPTVNQARAAETTAQNPRKSVQSDEELARRLQAEWNDENSTPNQNTPAPQPSGQWNNQQLLIRTRQPAIQPGSPRGPHSPAPMPQAVPQYQQPYQNTPSAPGQWVPARTPQYHQPSPIPPPVPQYNNQAPQYKDQFAQPPPSGHPYPFQTSPPQPNRYNTSAPVPSNRPYPPQGQPHLQYPTQHLNPPVLPVPPSQNPLILPQPKRESSLFKKFLKK